MTNLVEGIADGAPAGSLGEHLFGELRCARALCVLHQQEAILAPFTPLLSSRSPSSLAAVDAQRSSQSTIVS